MVDFLPTPALPTPALPPLTVVYLTGPLSNFHMLLYICLSVYLSHGIGVCGICLRSHDTPSKLSLFSVALAPRTSRLSLFGQVHELYERVNEVFRLAGDAVPLRAGMAVERQLAVAAEGSTLEPSEISAVASALEGLFDLREFFCGVKADSKVGVEMGLIMCGGFGSTGGGFFGG